jgi:hypothetical protein
MDNFQKLSFVNLMHNFVRTKAADAIQDTPRKTPCHVSKILPKDIVEVTIDATGVFTFPKLQIPQTFSKYSREPTQVGDPGYIVSCDYYLGGESGQSGGVANLYSRGNLTTGAFQPVSNTNWETRDPNKYYHTGGPTGYIARSADEKTYMHIDQFANITHNAVQGIAHIAGNLLSSTLPIQIPSGLQGIVHLAGNVLQGGLLPIPTNLQGIVHIAEQGIAHIADNALNSIIPPNLRGIVHFAQNAISHTSLSGIITHASLGGAINLVSQQALNIGAPSPTVQFDLTTPPVPTHPTSVNLIGSLSASINISAGGSIAAAGGMTSGGASVMTEPIPPGLRNAPITVTGSKGGNTALASLITALVNLGLITDDTTP